MTELTIQLPDELTRQLEEFSRRQNRSADDLVRESLRRYLDTEQLKAMRRIAVPPAEAQGYLTDEDVFRDVS